MLYTKKNNNGSQKGKPYNIYIYVYIYIYIKNVVAKVAASGNRPHFKLKVIYGA
jgi:hypothetical protein